MALVDFYFNSWRLVPANIVWGVLLLLIGGGADLQFLPAVVLMVGPARCLSPGYSAWRR